MAAAGDLESECIAIERLGVRNVSHPQVNVADAQALGSAWIGRGGRDFTQDIVDIERIGDHLQFVANPLPAVRRPVEIDLHAVAFGIVEIERLAHPVVGSAGERHLVACHMQDPAREVGARRHQEGGVIEAGAAGVVGLGVGPVLEMNEGHAARTERRTILAAIEHG